MNFLKKLVFVTKSNFKRECHSVNMPDHMAQLVDKRKYVLVVTGRWTLLAGTRANFLMKRVYRVSISGAKQKENNYK